MLDTHSSWFLYLTQTRKLSPEVIYEAELSEEKGYLRIPIFDEYGNEKFAKLRRPQNKQDGAKYLYEKGSSATLYGIHLPIISNNIYWLEGELEVLAMRTMGLTGYSGTGGAMTFRDEWLDYAENRPSVILFDNDETGIKGAVKLAQLLEVGTYTWVPPVYGKDVSDLVIAVGPEEARAILEDPTRSLSFDLRANSRTEKSKIGKKMKYQALAMDQCVGKKFLLELAFAIHMETRPPKKRTIHPGVENAITRAKEYPVENLIQLRQRKTRCLWHEEKTPSLHLYKDNHLFCHGSCNRAYDAIDVYMKQYNVSFMAAVEALNKL